MIIHYIKRKKNISSHPIAVPVLSNVDNNSYLVSREA